MQSKQTNNFGAERKMGVGMQAVPKLLPGQFFLIILHFLLLFVIPIIAENNWFQKVSRLMNIILKFRFKMKDLVLNLGKEAFPGQVKE